MPVAANIFYIPIVTPKEIPELNNINKIVTLLAIILRAILKC
jgi:hypothetical protein